MEDKKFKVIIVEDVKLELKGTEEIFRHEIPNAEVIGTAMTESEFWTLIEAGVPDLVLLDLGLGGSTTIGVDICRNIFKRYPGVHVLIFTGEILNEKLWVDVLNAGADGIILKTGELLTKTDVQAVMDGKKLVFNYPILEKIVDRFKQSVANDAKRQEAVISYDIDEYDERFLRHLALGYTKDMIANLKGMPFGVKSLEKRQNDLVNRLFPQGERVGVNATRLDDGYLQTLTLDSIKNLKSVRIVITSITNTAGDPWPALAEFKIFAATSGSGSEDTESIAYKKPVHTNAGGVVSRINDGSTINTWTGERYPAYVDIDLEANYKLDEIQVYTPSAGYSQYSVYTSMDGRDFEKLAEKSDKENCPAKGESYQANKKEARIVRVYVEYQSESSKALINEIRVLGTPSGTAVQETPAVQVEDFKNSAYNVTVTDQDTINEVKGIIERRIGAAYKDWFTFELADAANGYDYYDLSQSNGKIHIKGNNGVSLATGLNYYLKYYCNVNISQVGDQVTMPKSIFPVEGMVHKETKFPVRYSYNYCTLSYSMAFWGEEEWRNELDWLALNGVNVVLDATAQEEVWRRFLTELGYTHQEAKDFIAGPAYYAWAYMANLSGYGGPVHDTWFTERTELARKNQLIMRKLGMQPVLQGYSGMVPVDITSKDPSAEVIKQGTWCSFQRPSMLRTDSESFTKYAALFYKVQKEVYGDSAHYYATDPFHEGGNTGGMDSAVISQKVLASMMTADPHATWVIQSWQGNPTTALLQGLGDNRNHALVLDLYAEKTPHWNETNPGYYGGAEGGGEFLNTPWVYCMLNNFGGRLGLHGHIDNYVEGIVNASKQAEHMAGIGITPEASVNNPVLYDLFFETIWADDGNNLQKINLDEWFKNYVTRRYGADSDSAYQAMEILHDTVYNPAYNMKGQGAPESVVNARPGLDIGAASTWGNAVVDYDKKKLEKAAELLLADYDKLKNSAGYQYDLANVLEQVLSNTAQEYQKKMAAAFRSGDAEEFSTLSDKFLSIIDMVEKVTGTQKEFLVGTWINGAKKLAENSDDFTKELYELNARSLITTWGSYDQAISGGLIDYSNRQWAGLTNDYYKMRWEKWITERKKELAGESYTNYSAQDWFEMEWAWARGTNKYSGTPNGLDLQGLGTDVLANYSLTNMPKDPAEDDSRDLPLEGMTATAGSEQATTGSEGPASAVLDQTTGTIWHSKWSGDARENLWIDIALGESKTVTGLRMLPRSGGGNGTITSYRIEISNDHGKTYQEVATGTWNSSDSWKMAEFHAIQATNVRLYAVESVSDTSNIFASAAEIRIMGPATAIVPAEETIVNIATPSKEADLSSAQAAKETDKYTVSTVWKDATGTTVTAISKDKNATHDYTAKITLTPVTGYSFDKTSVPDTLTLKLNDQRTVEAIPVTDSVLNDDGTVTITYQFSNMFQGGSLRMDQSSPEKSTNMRFGYDFKLPEASSEKDEIRFKGCTWYYGVAEDDLKNTFSPDKTNFITNPDKKGAEYYRSNIVFTNLSSGAYKRSVYARILVKYTVNGKERSVMGTFVDSRSVSMIVEGILANTNADQTEKDYAQKIKDAILK